MYRAILTPPDKCKAKFKCDSCGEVEMRHIKCQVTGKPVGKGFEHVCRKCRGTMVLLPNPLLGECDEPCR